MRVATAILRKALPLRFSMDLLSFFNGSDRSADAVEMAATISLVRHCGGWLVVAVMTLGVRTLWHLGKMPITNGLKEQMVYRETRTLEQLLDGLTRQRSPLFD
jgi:hypothetical protein